MIATTMTSNRNSAIDLTMGALIGRDQRMLAFRRRDDQYWQLPGARAVHGEPVEQTLRTKLNNDLNSTVTFISFLAAIENSEADQHGVEHHELILVFDVGLRDADALRGSDQYELRWLSTADLTTVDLHPRGLRDGVLSGAFDEGTHWVAWRPASDGS